MTFSILKKIIEKHNIPEDVELLQDCGWECGATNLNGVWYNSKLNVIQFTQNGMIFFDHTDGEFEEPHDRKFGDNKDDWILLYYDDKFGNGGKTEL